MSLVAEDSPLGGRRRTDECCVWRLRQRDRRRVAWSLRDPVARIARRFKRILMIVDVKIPSAGALHDVAPAAENLCRTIPPGD